jgi:hypothetical protein
LGGCGELSMNGGMHRIVGGGHTWPGGPQYAPARLVGPVARHLDATGILLEMAQDEMGKNGGGRHTPLPWT